MKITQNQLRQLIKEEITKLSESFVVLDVGDDNGPDKFIKTAQENGLHAETLSFRGPGGGWPEVKLTGDIRLLEKFLTKHYDPDWEDYLDIQDDFTASRFER